MPRRRAALLAAAVIAAVPPPAAAVRPFITDDARVVGRHLVQMETWGRLDRRELQHWLLGAVGPTDWIELTVGFVYGRHLLAEEAGFAIAGPLFQAKVLVHAPEKNSWPGLAVAAGAASPIGVGNYHAPEWSGFGYVALTENLFDRERLLLHANIGFFTPSIMTGRPTLTWGFGAQVRTFAGMHVVAEVFSGDPYAASGGAATQIGLRYIVSDQIQIDATVGVGVWGEPALPVWGTAGLRLVSGQLW